jgi:sucrose-6-phosphate hydrolase SacC (GH32 family)
VSRDNKPFVRLAVAVLLAFVAGLLVGGYVGKKKGIPFVRKQEEYSIGIYTGESPFKLTDPEAVKNPVLRADDVSDVTARFVADPFMVHNKNNWYMFFEVMNGETNHGDIGLAVSDDGYNWTYKQIVLDESFHLSYPYVFEWESQFYMIPESSEAYCVRLYQAVDFPDKWEFVENLFSGNFCDCSIFRHDGRWWIFTSEGIRYDVLRLFHAKELLGPWEEHVRSPLILGDANIARPGGRVLLYDKRIFRFAQDCEPDYGNQVHVFEVIELTTESYAEKALDTNPILKGTGKGWNGERMHHIDPHRLDNNRWLTCVDGYGKFWVFGLQY